VVVKIVDSDVRRLHLREQGTTSLSVDRRVSTGEDRKEVVAHADGEGPHHEVLARPHRLAADESPDLGAPTRGPTPTTCCSRL
jgi:hypothetical protein